MRKRPASTLIPLLRLALLMVCGGFLSACALFSGPAPIPPPWEQNAAPATAAEAAQRQRLLTDISGSLRRSATYLASDPPGSLALETLPPVALSLSTTPGPAWKRAQVPAGSNPTTVGRVPPQAGAGYLIGAGDTIDIAVLGRPELSARANVAADGRVSVALAGPVQVGDLTPAQASERIAKALREGQYLVNPQVNVTFTEYQSQMVSVLGEVKNPGRFAVRTRLSVLDVLALAGGVVDQGAQLAYVLRPEDEKVTRYEINLDALLQAGAGQTYFELLPGDAVVVPKAEQFYIYGEVRSPNTYRIKSGMTVIQALAMAGGLTDKGSDKRVQLRRRAADGSLQKQTVELFDAVQPDDVIYVRERLF